MYSSFEDAPCLLIAIIFFVHLILSITIVLLVHVLCFSCSVFLFSVIALAIWSNFVMPIKHLREREWAKVRLDCISLFQCASDWFCWTWGADEGRLFTPTLLLFLYYNFCWVFSCSFKKCSWCRRKDFILMQTLLQPLILDVIIKYIFVGLGDVLTHVFSEWVRLWIQTANQ